MHIVQTNIMILYDCSGYFMYMNVFMFVIVVIDLKKMEYAMETLCFISNLTFVNTVNL